MLCKCGVLANRQTGGLRFDAPLRLYLRFLARRHGGKEEKAAGRDLRKFRIINAELTTGGKSPVL